MKVRELHVTKTINEKSYPCVLNDLLYLLKNKFQVVPRYGSSKRRSFTAAAATALGRQRSGIPRFQLYWSGLWASYLLPPSLPSSPTTCTVLPGPPEERRNSFHKNRPHRNAKIDSSQTKSHRFSETHASLHAQSPSLFLQNAYRVQRFQVFETYFDTLFDRCFWVPLPAPDTVLYVFVYSVHVPCSPSVPSSSSVPHVPTNRSCDDTSYCASYWPNPPRPQYSTECYR